MCGGEECHGGEHVTNQNCSFLGGQEARRETGRLGFQWFLQGTASNDRPSGFYHLMPTTGHQTFSIEAFVGTVKIQIYTLQETVVFVDF